MALAVKNNEAAGRFEAPVDGQMAIAAYRRDGDRIIFTHTEVPDDLQGQGIGGQLIEAALEHARAAGLRVVPRCAFVADYIAKHPEFQSLVAEQ